MGGLGGAEFLILMVIVVVLFGPTLIAFWLGFTLGRKKASGPAGAASTPASTPPESESKTAPTTEEPRDD